MNKILHYWAALVNSAFAKRLLFVLNPLRIAWAPIVVVLVTLGALVVIRTWSGKSNVATDRLQAEMNMQHDRFSGQLALITKTTVDFQARVVAAEKKRDELQSVYERDQLELTNTQKALKETQRALAQAQDTIKRIRTENATLLQRLENLGRQPSETEVLDRGDFSQEKKTEAQALRQVAEMRAKLVEIDRDLDQANSAWRENHRKFMETWMAYVALLRSIDETERSLALAQIPGRTLFAPTFQQPALPLVGRLLPPPLALFAKENSGFGQTEANEVGSITQRIEQDSEKLSVAQRAVEQIIHAIDETNGKIIAGQSRLKNLQASLGALSK